MVAVNCFVISSNHLLSTLLMPGVFKPSNGDDGIRTHDLRLAKAALSQLSYIPSRMHPAYRAQWAILDSNQRPRPYQRRALTS